MTTSSSKINICPSNKKGRQKLTASQRMFFALPEATRGRIDKAAQRLPTPLLTAISSLDHLGASRPGALIASD